MCKSMPEKRFWKKKFQKSLHNFFLLLWLVDHKKIKTAMSGPVFFRKFLFFEKFRFRQVFFGEKI